MAQYRTIAQAIKELKRVDENSAITEFTVRRLCQQNRLSVLRSGNTTYVDMVDLFKFMDGIDFEPRIITL